MVLVLTPLFLWTVFCPCVWLQTVFFLSVPKVVCKHLGQNDLSLLQAPAATLAEPLWQMDVLSCTEVWMWGTSSWEKDKVWGLKAPATTQRILGEQIVTSSLTTTKKVTPPAPVTEIPQSAVLGFFHRRSGWSSSYLLYPCLLWLQIPWGWTSFHLQFLCTSLWLL